MRILAVVLAGALSLQEKGDKAPDFTLKNQDGKDVKLSDFAGKKHVLLSFYPKDMTPG
jgi:peroxiredoxin Q/BCP